MTNFLAEKVNFFMASYHFLSHRLTALEKCLGSDAEKQHHFSMHILYVEANNFTFIDERARK